MNGTFLLLFWCKVNMEDICYITHLIHCENDISIPFVRFQRCFLKQDKSCWIWPHKDTIPGYKMLKLLQTMVLSSTVITPVFPSHFHYATTNLFLSHESEAVNVNCSSLELSNLLDRMTGKDATWISAVTWTRLTETTEEEHQHFSWLKVLWRSSQLSKVTELYQKGLR